MQQPPLSVQCPWCKTQYNFTQLGTNTNCKNCGGTLEYQFNFSEVGPQPPPAPRFLPPKFVKRIKYTSNVKVIIGLVFMIVFCWTIIFPIIGFFIWRSGLKEAKNELVPLRNGTPVLGTVTAVRVDGSKRINDRFPMIVDFIFDAHGRSVVGSVGNIFADMHLLKQPGQKVWVVYMPDDPNLSSIWPPLK